MIRVELEPQDLILNETNVVTLRFTNVGSGPCTNLVFRFALPSHMLLLRGQDQIEIPRLNAGQSLAYTLHVRAREAGQWWFTAANFSYRDARGMTQRITQFRLPLEVHPTVIAAPDTALSAAQRAQALEAQGRYDQAWRLYLEANLFQNAGVALQKAVRQLAGEGRHVEAARQCEEWVQVMIAQGGRYSVGKAELAGWLEYAAEQFFLARDRTNQERCRERAAQLMEIPRFLLEVEASPGVQFFVGHSTRITVRITNQGYGPARGVKLRLTGDIEEPYPEHVLHDLQVGETHEWDTARITPRRPGDILLRLEVTYHSYREHRSGYTTIEYFVPVADPTGVLGSLTQGGGTVHLHIAKLLAPGATSNEISISDSVVVGRAPLIAGGSSMTHSMTSPGGADRDRYCSQCGTVRPSSQPRCPKCGALTCTTCGAILPPGARFCSECKSPA